MCKLRSYSRCAQSNTFHFGSKGLVSNARMAASKGFMYHLSMAACEWFLMFLMFIDAALAYILTKFARHYDLQSPCMFCLRLDHVFGNEKPGSYLTSFCNNHRAQVSCLISCDLHDKLADVREMCDHCFMSTTKYQKSYLNKNLVRAPSSAGMCSCCNRQWKVNLNGRRSLQPGAIRLGPPKVTMKPPMPRVAGRGRGRGRFRRRNTFKRVRDKISGNSTPCLVENNIGVDVDMDTLSDSGCAELRFNSDSEPEVTFSKVENATSKVVAVGKERDSEDDSPVMHDMSSQNQDETRAEHFNSVSDPQPSLLTSNGSIGHGPEELNHVELHARVVSAPSVPQDMDLTPGQRKLSADDVKGNGPLEVSKDKMSLPSRGSNQDMHSLKSDENNDCEASTSSDKNDGYESPGASSVSEIEGESAVDKLKRQVEYDRERLHLLHKELEEERNAAAIAADEAMAMITRLQEEKASLHMEALQYLRMMDEQAEYDMEALDKANDLIAEKDKEIQDLEAELEYFRCRYEDELFMGNTTAETENLGGYHMGNGKTDVGSSYNSTSTKVLEPRDKPVCVKAPVFDLEDEKRYISQCLSELERKFHQFSSVSNGNIHAETQSDHKDSSTSNGAKKRVSADGGEVDVGTLENGISDLNGRLEALEADRDFLEHACNTLQTSEGLEFIKEIAHHLQDLRRIRCDRRCQSVA